jgi:hypothetical protein
MHPHVKVVALFAAISLAACTENPVDNQRRLIIGGSSPKSVQLSTEWAPLTLSTADAYEPFQLNGVVDQNGYVSKDNPPANMGNDRPVHIKYWGGRLILQQSVVSVYYASSPIYNGGPAAGTTGTGAADGSLVGFYLRNMGGSARWNVNTTYSQTVDKTESFVQNTMNYAGFWATPSGPTSGATVTKGQMVGLIEAGFNSGKLTYDPNTLYVIFTGSGVNLGGGFSHDNLQYCAFHGAYRRANGTFVQISAMPYDADFTPAHPAAGNFICVPQNGAPNGDVGADGIVSALQHETEETTTDPGIVSFAGWFDIQGFESSDKCAYIYGPVFRNTKGFFNIAIGGKPFLVQGQWQRAASTPERCTTSL